jgi:hypothetical protein
MSEQESAAIANLPNDENDTMSTPVSETTVKIEFIKKRRYREKKLSIIFARSNLQRRRRINYFSRGMLFTENLPF